MSNMIPRRRRSQLSENWTTATYAIKYLRDGLCPFVDRVVQLQHTELMWSVKNKKCNRCSSVNLLPYHASTRRVGQQCRYKQKDCPCTENGTNRRTCPNNVCGFIYDSILDRYKFKPPTPCWKNTDVSKWCSDAWEVAKCFISFPGYLKKIGPTEIDCTGLLHVLINNKAFHRHLQHRINGKDVFCKVRSDIEAIFRNPTHELDETTMSEYLGDMIKVLQDGKVLRNIEECEVAVENISELLSTDEEYPNDYFDMFRSFSISENEEEYDEDEDYDYFDENADIYARFSSRYESEFQHEASIGRGAYGVVFQATQKIDRHTYAVKRIILPKSEDSKEKVRREVQSLAKLEHPNIVRYYNSWIETPPEGWQEERDARMELSQSTLSSSTSSSDARSQEDIHFRQPRSYLYIQMQLCKTKTLRDWLEENIEREKSVVLDWFEQVTLAIRYVHGKHLVHRDLKPANIFFTDEDIVKVGDFGLATAVDENEQALFYNDIGTSFYRSPEIKAAKGKMKSEKVDIFSMGIILFEMLQPFNTQSERGKVLQDLHEYKYPTDFSTAMPNEKDLVSCLTAVNPEERPTAKEILSNYLPSLRAENTTNQI